VPRARVELLEASNSDVMTFIVSGGVSGLTTRTTPPPTRVPASATE
jgi:hypothetical protein